MSAARLLGALVPLVLLIAAAGVWWMLRRERRNPSAYSRRPDVLASRHGMSTAEQQAVDNAALDAAEAAEAVVDRDALDLEVRAQHNALFRP